MTMRQTQERLARQLLTLDELNKVAICAELFETGAAYPVGDQYQDISINDTQKTTAYIRQLGSVTASNCHGMTGANFRFVLYSQNIKAAFFPRCVLALKSAGLKVSINQILTDRNQLAREENIKRELVFMPNETYFCIDFSAISACCIEAEECKPNHLICKI